MFIRNIYFLIGMAAILILVVGVALYLRRKVGR